MAPPMKTPTSSAKKRSRASAIVIKIGAGFPDNRDERPEYIGSENKNPGTEEIAATYFPYVLVT